LGISISITTGLRITILRNIVRSNAIIWDGNIKSNFMNADLIFCRISNGMVVMIYAIFIKDNARLDFNVFERRGNCLWRRRRLLSKKITRRQQEQRYQQTKVFFSVHIGHISCT